MRLVLHALFNVADPGACFPNGIPARETPGIFGHVAAYLGVVEPQMRKALHIHMLVQLLGMSHPRDIFGNNVVEDTFRKVWYFVASISFRSSEAFARHLHTPAAMNTLAERELLPLTPKQRGMIGDDRVREAVAAQLEARGVTPTSHRPVRAPPMRYFTSDTHKNDTCSAEAWATHTTQEVLSGTMKTGNHVCRPDVCHKGSVGRKGFCRMFFWHWCRHVEEKRIVAKRSHGLKLQKFWDGVG